MCWKSDGFVNFYVYGVMGVPDGFRNWSFKEKALYLQKTQPERFGHIPIRTYNLDTDPIKKVYEEIMEWYDKLDREKLQSVTKDQGK